MLHKSTFFSLQKPMQAGPKMGHCQSIFFISFYLGLSLKGLNHSHHVRWRYRVCGGTSVHHWPTRSTIIKCIYWSFTRNLGSEKTYTNPETKAIRKYETWPNVSYSLYWSWSFESSCWTKCTIVASGTFFCDQPLPAKKWKGGVDESVCYNVHLTFPLYEGFYPFS